MKFKINDMNVSLEFETFSKGQVVSRNYFYGASSPINTLTVDQDSINGGAQLAVKLDSILEDNRPVNVNTKTDYGSKFSIYFSKATRSEISQLFAPSNTGLIVVYVYYDSINKRIVLRNNSNGFIYPTDLTSTANLEPLMKFTPGLTSGYEQYLRFRTVSGAQTRSDSVVKDAGYVELAVPYKPTKSSIWINSSSGRFIMVKNGNANYGSGGSNEDLIGEKLTIEAMNNNSFVDISTAMKTQIVGLKDTQYANHSDKFVESGGYEVPTLNGDKVTTVNFFLVSVHNYSLLFELNGSDLRALDDREEDDIPEVDRSFVKW